MSKTLSKSKLTINYLPFSANYSEIWQFGYSESLYPKKEEEVGGWGGQLLPLLPKLALSKVFLKSIKNDF